MCIHVYKGRASGWTVTHYKRAGLMYKLLLAKIKSIAEGNHVLVDEVLQLLQEEPLDYFQHNKPNRIKQSDGKNILTIEFHSFKYCSPDILI